MMAIIPSVCYSISIIVGTDVNYVSCIKRDMV